MKCAVKLSIVFGVLKFVHKPHLGKCELMRQILLFSSFFCSSSYLQDMVAWTLSLPCLGEGCVTLLRAGDHKVLMETMDWDMG